jgi:hypothetical protein
MAPFSPSPDVPPAPATVKLYVEVAGTVQYCIPEMRLRLLGYEGYTARVVGAIFVAPFRVVNVNELFIVKLNVVEYDTPLQFAVMVTLDVPKETPWKAVSVIPESSNDTVKPAGSSGYVHLTGVKKELGAVNLRISVAFDNVYKMTSPGFCKIFGFMFNENIKGYEKAPYPAVTVTLVVASVVPCAAVSVIPVLVVAQETPVSVGYVHETVRPSGFEIVKLCDADDAVVLKYTRWSGILYNRFR